jgi:hypothetical protein
MLTAREAYETRLQEIREERAALQEERLYILEALRKMDEAGGGQDVQSSPILEEMREALGQMRELVPAVSVTDMIEYLVKTKLPANAADMVVAPQEDTSESFRKEVEQAKDREAAKKKPKSKESRKVVIPKTGARRTEIMTKLVRDFMRERGGLISAGDVKLHLKTEHDVDYTSTALTAVLKRAMENYPSIVKAGYGKYKYLDGVTVTRESDNFDDIDQNDENDAEASSEPQELREYTLV